MDTWSSVINYFQDLEQRPLERMAILVGGLLFFWVLEGAIPVFSLRYRTTKLNHAAVNFAFTVIHLIIHSLLAIIIVGLSDWCQTHSFGIVHWTQAGIGWSVLIGVLALDFSSWWVHWVMHRSSWLWKFHLIHHSDTKVDVTTGLRHHPGDSLLRGLFFILFIFISGAPMYAVMIYQTLVVGFTAFTHANISLPPVVDKIVSYLFVSPNMHKVHHHRSQPYTDTNYGAVLSIWDRTLGTFSQLAIHEVQYGIDRYYPAEKDEELSSLLKNPFLSSND